MSSAVLPASASFGGIAIPPTEPMMQLSVAQYHQMAAAGILDEDDHVELLEGWLVPKMTKKPAHWIAVNLIRQMLERLQLSDFFVHCQDPITTGDSEPEPDIAVVRGDVRQYLSHHPLGRDSCLVVEVADSTLHRDRGIKKRIYARAGIPLYWIVNLTDRQIEVYSAPTGPAELPDFANCQIAGEATEVAVVIDGREVAKLSVKDLLP